MHLIGQWHSAWQFVTFLWFWHVLLATSVYPAKGQPGSGTTKLEHKSVWYGPASKAKGHAPVPCAIGPCRCRTTGQRAGELANSDRRPLCRPACITCGDFFEVGNFGTFSEFLHIKGRNFLDVFISSRLSVTPMNNEKFHGNRSARFWEIRKTDTYTQTRQLYLYID